MDLDLERFTMEELLLAAIKSESESEKVYDALADRVRNAFLKDRLRFLAGEEVKHRAFLESVFRRTFPDKEMSIHEVSPVPLPFINLGDEATMPLSKVLEEAMVAEKAAHDFYESLARMSGDDPGIKGKLRYLANMEMAHYRLLEMESESLREFEDHLDDWPMMHAGP